MGEEEREDGMKSTKEGNRQEAKEQTRKLRTELRTERGLLYGLLKKLEIENRAACRELL